MTVPAAISSKAVLISPKPIQIGPFLWVQDADGEGLRDAAVRAEAAGFDSRWVRMRDTIAGARSVLEEDLRRHGVQAPAPWLPLVGSPATVADGLKPLIDVGFRHLLIALAAPFDRETIDRLPDLRKEPRARHAIRLVGARGLEPIEMRRQENAARGTERVAGAEGRAGRKNPARRGYIL